MLVVATISACGFDTAESVTVPEAEPYRLDNGDRLRITVFGQDTMSGEYVVDGSGFISLPLLEQVEARVRTSTAPTTGYWPVPAANSCSTTT